MLPTWWARESGVLSSSDAIRSEIDAEAVGSRLLAHGFTVIDGFLGRRAAARIRSEIIAMDRAGRLKLGRLQHGTALNTDAALRNDRIAFVQPDACAPPLAAYLGLIDRLRDELARAPELAERLGGEPDGCNYMAAIYPGGGSRYVKHRDALPYKAGRKLTAIYYLNPDWVPAHGGELQLWPEVQGVAKPAVRVAPRSDRLVLFVSSLEHEVLPAWAPRYALTTWMFSRRDTAMESLAEDMRQRKVRAACCARSRRSAIPGRLPCDPPPRAGGGQARRQGASRCARRRLVER